VSATYGGRIWAPWCAIRGPWW